jgi:ParB/RepB/Spo0J family partition protein
VTVGPTPTIAIELIAEIEGIDPRKMQDQDELNQLAESIKEHGILQPVLLQELTKAPKGKTHGIVAGRRRLAAAKIAGLTEIPYHELEIEADARAAALVENVQRQDLSPLEEAEAVHALQEAMGDPSTAVVGKRLGRSDDWVQRRLNLLRLPAKARTAVAEGKVGLHGAIQLGRIAGALPNTVDVISDAIENGEIDRHEIETGRAFAETVGWAVEVTHDAGAEEPDVVVRVGHQQLASRLDWIPDDLREQVSALPGGYGWLLFGQQDADAARAFGCLLELDGAAFITDREFLIDRVRLWAEEQAKKAKRNLGQQQSTGGTAGGGEDDEQSKIDAKEARRQQREREQDERAQAMIRNAEIGRTTAEALKKPKVTVDVARVIAEWARKGLGAGLAARGLRYVDDRLVEIEEQKNGKQKRIYAGSTDSEALLDEQLERAATVEEVFGVLLRAATLAATIDQGVVAQSNQIGFYGGYEFESQILPIARKAKALPKSMLDELAAKERADRERREIELAQAEARILLELDRTKKRREEGLTVGEIEQLMRTQGASLPAHARGWVRADDQAAALARLKRSKAIERGKDRVTITEAGRKHLKQLAAEHKKREAARTRKPKPKATSKPKA